MVSSSLRVVKLHHVYIDFVRLSFGTVTGHNWHYEMYITIVVLQAFEINATIFSVPAPLRDTSTESFPTQGNDGQ